MNWLIANLSITVSSLALLVSMASFMTARKSMKMNQQDFLDKRRSLQMYLVQGAKRKRNKKIQAEFLLSFSNPATAPQTIVDVDLDLKYIDRVNHIHSVLLKPLPPEKPNLGRNAIVTPFKLDARDAVTGWVTFDLVDRIIDEMKIERYKIVAKTQEGENLSIDVHLLMEVLNDDKEK